LIRRSKPGLLEKPTLSAPFTQYQEVNYKIMLIGKSFSGKSSIIESLCNKKPNETLTLNSNASNYCETPGNRYFDP